MQQTINLSDQLTSMDALKEMLSITVNELIALDIIKESNIIHKHDSPQFLDESYSEYMVIQIPNLDQDPAGREFQKDFLHILFLKFPNLKPEIPEEETCHLYLINDQESADIHFNDSTLHIFYHYTGQW